jgi:hypothetical protein
MIIRNERELTRAVLDELEHASNPRFREIMTAAVRHLHDFVREARLTESEFQQACAIIARLGQATTPAHNEVVLMAARSACRHWFAFSTTARRRPQQRPICSVRSGACIPRG